MFRAIFTVCRYFGEVTPEVVRIAKKRLTTDLFNIAVASQALAQSKKENDTVQVKFKEACAPYIQNINQAV
jgi:hypothetical protein